MTSYEEHPLSRLVNIQAIVSADDINGQEHGIQLHAHQAAWELCICLAGEALVTKDTHDIPLQPGQLLFVPPGTMHVISTLQKHARAFIVSFTCDSSSGEYLTLLHDTLLPVTNEIQLLLEKIISELKTSFEQQSNSLRMTRFTPRTHSAMGSEQMICCYLELLLLNLLREVTMDRGEIVSSGQLQNALQLHLVRQVTGYIRAHLGDQLSADEVARHFHYSRARLSAICKTVTGLGINKLIGYERMQAAKELLAAQEKTVAQISEELGFSSPQYFSHKFSQEVGCPPSQYAKI